MTERFKPNLILQILKYSVVNHLLYSRKKCLHERESVMEEAKVKVNFREEKKIRNV